MGKLTIDITGQRFGMLTVRCKTDKRDKYGKILWLCDCDCGESVYLNCTNLKNGYKSCGCIKIRNSYVEKDDHMIGYLKNGKEFYFDKEDYEFVKQYNWHEDKGYIRSEVGALHRLIMNAPKDLVVDHINHNTYDNRKQNLRLCTIQQNNLNRKNAKGYTLRKTGKYEVNMTINGINTYIGYFDTKEEAITAREQYYDENRKKFSNIKLNK